MGAFLTRVACIAIVSKERGYLIAILVPLCRWYFFAYTQPRGPGMVGPRNKVGASVFWLSVKLYLIPSCLPLQYSSHSMCTGVPWLGMLCAP